MAKKLKIPGWPEVLSPTLPGIPGFPNPLTNSFAGGMDFVRNLWGGLPTTVPGFVVPTIDLDELDKRIKDLRAVESWLDMNANMVRASVQALEVQRHTIAAVKTLGGSLGGQASDMLAGLAASAATASATPAATPGPAVSAQAPARRRSKAPAPAAAPGFSANAWLNFLQDQFAKVASAAVTSDAKKTPMAAKSAPRAHRKSARGASR